MLEVVFKNTKKCEKKKMWSSPLSWLGVDPGFVNQRRLQRGQSRNPENLTEGIWSSFFFHYHPLCHLLESLRLVNCVERKKDKIKARSESGDFSPTPGFFFRCVSLQCCFPSSVQKWAKETLVTVCALHGTTPHNTFPSVPLHIPLWVSERALDILYRRSGCLFCLSAKPPPLSSPVFLYVRDAAVACQLLICLSVSLRSLLSADTTVSSQTGKTQKLSTLQLPLCVCVLACISKRGHTSGHKCTSEGTRGQSGDILKVPTCTGFKSLPFDV